MKRAPIAMAETSPDSAKRLATHIASPWPYSEPRRAMWHPPNFCRSTMSPPGWVLYEYALNRFYMLYSFSTPALRTCTCLSIPFLLGPPSASLFSTLFSKLNTLSMTSGSNLSDSSRYCSYVMSERLHFCFSAKATARPEM